jgi:hypothetical protein
MNRSYTLLAIVAISIAACQPTKTIPDNDRLAEVVQKGSMVMPFDLDATTHVFDKTADGGVQQVVSDVDDPQQVALIREHLNDLAKRFAAGNFHDPEMIHGSAMPGLHELVVGHERIAIAYSEIESGAQIIYSTEDKELVKAIHSWFDAQLSDHGDHAMSHR